MQGTWHVRSLFRLFIGAVLLCLAWLVLTSGHASAAERPAPERSHASLGLSLRDVDGTVDGLVSGLLAKPSGPARPAQHSEKPVKATPTTKVPANPKPVKQTPRVDRPRDEKPSAATDSTSVGRVAAPVVTALGTSLADVTATLRPTVETGLTLVDDVAEVTAPLPVLGESVTDVTDAVAGLVRTLPVLGEPLPIVPLPIGDGIVPGAPGPSATPQPADRAVAHDTRSRGPAAADAGAFSIAPSVGRQVMSHPATPHAVPTTRPGDHTPSWPSGLGGPAPTPPAPAMPGGVGSGPAALDQALATDGLVLAHLSSSHRTGADWRLPCGLSAQPGTRPD